ncbi:MAG: transcription termination factor Rho [Clostridia bacterium]|nr:transcription termination factor Rho [Clostridia bacterium]
MTEKELSAMTVMQLRKLAKEQKITLGAGIDKAGIIQKLLDESDNDIIPQLNMESTEAEPRFQAAWHNSDAPRFSARPAYQAPGTAPRPAWQNTTPSGHQLPRENRILPVRPGGSAPRFGPAPSAASSVSSDTVQVRKDTSSTISNPLPEHRFGDTPAYSHRISANYTPAYNPAAKVPEPYTPVPAQDPGISAPTLEELLASGNYQEGSGILELHPDGYGFLRAPSFLPSTKDIYVSMAQIRRFGLRTGDYIEGKIRPQREGDKYSALLYITTINGVSEEEAFTRPAFDELTPVYPTRRISLESADGSSHPDMRLIDLIAPIGFGQRGLVLCPPNTGKTELMSNFARVICSNYPDAEVLMLLIDVTPEDATLMRESVPCQVLSSSFDQAPEAHLRLSEIVLERAMRLVEQKKDVILLVDSLTRLAKIYTTAAVQQGRSLPGMVNPASLFRAKRMFGAARSCKEGGSLTVIAAMDIATGSKVDDSVVEEFKGTANMELTLDLSVARAGIVPALNLQHSFTKNADILLNDQQKEGLSLIRTMLGSTSSAVAIPQLISMMEKADTNAALLLKMKDWFALMNR